MIREKSNSAHCGRDQPCIDCAKILVHFPFEPQELWSRIEAKKAKKQARPGAKANAQMQPGPEASEPGRPMKRQKPSTAFASGTNFSHRRHLSLSAALPFPFGGCFKGRGRCTH